MRAITLSALLVLVPVLAGAQQPCTSDADSTVDAIYRQVLERPAGGEGNGRAEHLRNGQTSVRDIVRDIAKSPEHLQRFLPANNRTQAVTNLYRHLLGRDPDPAGLSSHVQARDSLAAVADYFIDSPEYQQRFGDDRVPGGTVRYCRNGSGSAAANESDRRFRNMDRNGNGVIERDEWNVNRGSFEQYDWNNDGILSGDELRRGARRPPQAVGRDNRADANYNSFASLDTNKSGTITPDEWKWTVRSFNRYDTDRDNLLTRREFDAGGGAPDSDR